MLNHPRHALVVMEQRRIDLMAEVARERQLEAAQPPATLAPSRLRRILSRLGDVGPTLRAWHPAPGRRAADHLSASP